MLFYAEVATIGKLPDSEIGAIKLVDNLSQVNLTYRQIYPSLFKKVTEYLQAIDPLGIKLQNIIRRQEKIHFTHQDWDHIGNIADIQDALGNELKIYTHTNERKYIEGVVPYIKMTPERIQARIQSLPEYVQKQAASLFANIPTVHVHKTFEDQEVLPFHDNVQVIHTAGHSCLYLKQQRLLIAGDQLRLQNGILLGPAPEHTVDMRVALQSLSKLQEYDIDYVICYHGGLYGPRASVRIAELVAEHAR